MNRIATTAAALVFGIAAATAQDRTADTDAAREAVIKALDAALPRWSEEILVQPDTRDWTEELTLSSAVRALNVRELAPMVREAPGSVEVVQNKAAALQVVPEMGQVRYVDRTQVVDLTGDRGELPDEQSTFEFGISALGRLGLPADEFAKPEILTQMAAGGSVEAREPERIDEVYRLFLVERVINGLPVIGSRAIVSVADTGRIQRLRTQWPAFRMDRGDELVGRDTVLEQAADVLIDYGTSGETEFRAQLGYAPANGDAGAPYIPVASISALIEPTPVLISVPLVAPGDVDER